MAEKTEVDKLRHEWLEAVRQSHTLHSDFAAMAGVLSIDSTTDRTIGPMAQIRVAQEKADVIRVAYEDARADLQTQQADDQLKAADELARTNTKLAKVQAWLAAAITLATIAQTIMTAVK